VVEFIDGGPIALNSDFSALVAARIVRSAQVQLLIRLVDGRCKYLVNVIRITQEWLAARCGVKQGRNAWGWIQTLVEHKLIDVIDHDKERGTYDLRIHDPTPEHGDDQNSTPQKPLPFPTGDESPGEGTGFSFAQELAQISARRSAHDPAAQNCARTSAQNSARSSARGMHSDSNPERPDSRPPPPSSHPPGETAQNSARSSAPPPMITNEELHSNSSMLQRTQGEPSLDSLGALGDTVEEIARQLAKKRPPRTKDEADAIVLEAISIHRRQAAKEPPTIGEAIAGRLELAVKEFRATVDPAEQREHWKRQINLAVGNPPDRDWLVAGKTATLIVNGHAEPSRVKKFIDSVSRRRRLAEDDENFIANAEAWFQRVVARLCSERGVPFAKSRVVAGELQEAAP